MSPIFVSLIFFSPGIRKPTSPAMRSSLVFAVGAKTPKDSTSVVFFVAINLTAIPFFNIPSNTLTSRTTPWYKSYHESTIKTFRGAFFLPLGSGILTIIASSTSFIPIPCLALTKIESEESICRTSSICFFTFSGSALGKSILLITGIILRSCSMARFIFAMV